MEKLLNTPVLEKCDPAFNERNAASVVDSELLSDWELSRRRPRHLVRRLALGSTLLLFLLAWFALHTTKTTRPQTADLPKPIIRHARDSHGSLLGSKAEKAVVLASYQGQNTSWTDDIPEDWTIYTYTHPGREHHTYLHHIINKYHTLPPYTLFTHGHLQSWHQIVPMPWLLRSLNLTSLSQRGFINLRCAHDSGCTRNTLLGAKHQIVEVDGLAQMLGSGNMTGRFWEAMLTPYGFGAYPDEIGGACCAQFAVTREAVRARPLAFWRAYAEPLSGPVEEMQARFGMEWREKQGGALYEYLWHVVFGRPAVDCPGEEVCRGEFFGGAIECERYPGRFQRSAGWQDVRCEAAWEKGARESKKDQMAVNRTVGY